MPREPDRGDPERMRVESFGDLPMFADPRPSIEAGVRALETTAGRLLAEDPVSDALEVGARRVVRVRSLVLPEPPSSNRWWRMVGPRMVTSKEARAYKEVTSLRALGQGVRQIRRPNLVAIEIHWYRHRRAGDLDKRLGILLDALQAVGYENDSQVIELHAFRHDAPNAGRIEVTLTELAAA